MAVYIKNHAGGKGMDPAGVPTSPASGAGAEGC